MQGARWHSINNPVRTSPFPPPPEVRGRNTGRRKACDLNVLRSPRGASRAGLPFQGISMEFHSTAMPSLTAPRRGHFMETASAGEFLMGIFHQ